jgi:N-acetylneuraminic acid mutarotase
MPFTQPVGLAGAILAFLCLGCSGDGPSTPPSGTADPPTVVTADLSGITGTTAMGGGEVTRDGGAPVTARGVVWSTTPGPTLERGDGKSTDGQGTGSFTSALRHLLPATTHFVRAYATNSAGTAYGNQVMFDTRDGSNHQAAGLSLGGMGYIGTGLEGSGSSRELWAYDPVAAAWTRKADFGGGARHAAVGFTVQGKGYVGAGREGFVPGSSWLRDLWAYDPATDTWTRKADFLELERFDAVAFSIGDRGYMGTGTGPGPTLRFDFWEYEPAADAWTQKADFSAAARSLAVGFSIRDKGYLGTGWAGMDREDFWEYDPATDSWTQRADFGGGARSGAVGFSIGGKGYVGTGLRDVFGELVSLKDFWEYDPTTDTWTRKADFQGAARSGAVGFSIGDRGFVGTGLHEGPAAPLASGISGSTIPNGTPGPEGPIS